MIKRPMMKMILASVIGLVFYLQQACSQDSTSNPIGSAAKADEVITLWTAQPPGPKRIVGAEQDFTKSSDKLIAGKRIIKLGNVAIPELHVFHPAPNQRNGTTVVICPGGGFHILAWDLEGTEVATWLNSLGVTAAVLKYRVPTNRMENRWLAPVQDAQRSLSIVRSKAVQWNIQPNRIGVLGFSAGGYTAAVASFQNQRFYKKRDATDQFSCTPDFSILIYAAGMSNKAGTGLSSELAVDANSPPTFMAHAFDDFVPLHNCLNLMSALSEAEVPSELHVYDRGGHGYGLRKIASQPVTSWDVRCAEWLKTRGLLDSK